MTIHFIPLYVLVGAGMAFLILKSQWWSVFAIHPDRPKASKRLIIGGAIIRWLFIAIILIAAGTVSSMALFTVFISFMISRLLILSLWQKAFNSDKTIHQHKG